MNYAHLSVSREMHAKLAAEARRLGTSIPQLLEQLLGDEAEWPQCTERTREAMAEARRKAHGFTAPFIAIPISDELAARLDALSDSKVTQRMAFEGAILNAIREDEDAQREAAAVERWRRRNPRLSPVLS